ncbi:MAG TPA: hypothetical protein PKA41_11080 [Verrucomicrobiota bacterium]|nr:hypothetical protein [Verrucomicrobiota bacterium]
MNAETFRRAKLIRQVRLLAWEHSIVMFALFLMLVWAVVEVWIFKLE